MKIYIKNKEGFTLIELLVVVAIISLLSSVVFASLSSARKKTKDAAIKEEVSQLASLMTLNYNDYGNYCNLTTGWMTTVADCSAIANGTYGPNAQNICTNIINNAVVTAGGKMYASTGLGCANVYSFMVFLNDGKYFCSGSSGAKGEYTAYSNFADGSDFGLTPGCYMQP